MVTPCFSIRKIRDKIENDATAPIRFLSARGDRAIDFQWHDICSIHARRTIFEAGNSPGLESSYIKQYLTLTYKNGSSRKWQRFPN